MLGTPVFGEFLPFYSANPLKLCQVGWGASLQSYFQVSPEMFNRVQIRALAGPLKDIQRLVPKPLMQCLGCVLRVVVRLECEHSPNSEVLTTLEQVLFIAKYIATDLYYKGIDERKKTIESSLE